MYVQGGGLSWDWRVLLGAACTDRLYAIWDAERNSLSKATDLQTVEWTVPKEDGVLMWRCPFESTTQQLKNIYYNIKLLTLIHFAAVASWRQCAESQFMAADSISTLMLAAVALC